MERTENFSTQHDDVNWKKNFAWKIELHYFFMASFFNSCFDDDDCDTDETKLEGDY